jgi:hypothetical protein
MLVRVQHYPPNLYELTLYMINSIDYQKFEKEFLQTDVGKRIKKDFDHVTCVASNIPSIIFMKNKFNTTCRELLGRNDLVVKKPMTMVSIVTFYYLKFLQEINPTQIYDIGCGWNLWKRYIPNIHGIDSNSEFADEIASYDDNWVDTHYRQLEAAFTINMDVGLKDGVPCTFRNMSDQIMNFSKIIKPGGRGYISLAAWGLLRYTDWDWYNENNCNPYDPGSIIAKTKEIILKLPLTIVALDCEFDIFRNIPAHDGELRIVFEVPNDLEV